MPSRLWLSCACLPPTLYSLRRPWCGAPPPFNGAERRPARFGRLSRDSVTRGVTYTCERSAPYLRERGRASGSTVIRSENRADGLLVLLSRVYCGGEKPGASPTVIEKCSVGREVEVIENPRVD